MSRPPSRWPISSVQWETDFGISTSHTLHGVHRKVLDAIVRCRTGGHWAVIWISASAAAIRPFIQLMPQSALPQVSGQRARKMARGALAELLPVPYFHVVFTLPHELSALSSRTSDCSTTCSTAPAQRRCSNWLATPKHLEPISDSLACSIPGDRNSSIILTSTT